jgi:hypothetical protein
MGSPPKRKSLLKGIDVPWRLHVQNLRAALFHGQLRKVRVMLKVYRVTEMSENQKKDIPSWDRCLALYQEWLEWFSQ